MNVFVTGGTGYIGTAVVNELISADHEVTVLTRKPSERPALQQCGAALVQGDMTVPKSYRSLAENHDALIHIAYQHENDTAKADKIAIETLLQAANNGRGRMVVYSSGCHVLGDTGNRVADEESSTDRPAPNVTWRPTHEQMALVGAEDSVTTAVIRPGVVYGGSGGLTAKLFESARTAGPAVFVGDGENFWSMVHRRDLARLYRLVVEKKASGVYHGVDGQPIKVKDVASKASEVAGGGGVIASMKLEIARSKIGPLADALCMNQVVVPRRSADLGWRPECSSFGAAAERAYKEWCDSVKQEIFSH